MNKSKTKLFELKVSAVIRVLMSHNHSYHGISMPSCKLGHSLCRCIYAVSYSQTSSKQLNFRFMVFEFSTSREARRIFEG